MPMLSGYLTIFRRLAEAKADYLVVGGLAVNFHGVPRMTFDIDIMPGPGRKGIAGIHSLLLQTGYRCKLPIAERDLTNPRVLEDWRETKNLKAVSYYHADSVYPEIDLVLPESVKEYRRMRRSATIFVAEEIRIPTACREDLIAMKRKAGRRQDKSDVRELRRLAAK
ncbi:MAG: hypothetical protein RDV41_14490 [Planctomycetota bacterium]|nr:hypothetical protein [Planctomycetota bacterium]